MERELRVEAERRMTELEAAESRTVSRLQQQLERQAREHKQLERRLAATQREFREQAERIFGAKLNQIAAELAESMARQERDLQVNASLKEERTALRQEVADLKQQLEAVQTQHWNREWEHRKQMACFQTSHALSHHAVLSPSHQHHFVRSATIEKGFSIASTHRGSLGSDPSLPSGHSPDHSPPFSVAAGEGLASHTASFLTQFSQPPTLFPSPASFPRAPPPSQVPPSAFPPNLPFSLRRIRDGQLCLSSWVCSHAIA